MPLLLWNGTGQRRDKVSKSRFCSRGKRLFEVVVHLAKPTRTAVVHLSFAVNQGLKYRIKHMSYLWERFERDLTETA